MMKSLRFLFFFIVVLFGVSSVQAGFIAISNQETFSLVEHSEIHLDKDHRSVDDVAKNAHFVPSHKPLVIAGVTDRTIWLKLQLANQTDRPLRRAIVVRSSRLEHLTLYRQNRTRTGYRAIPSHNEKEITLYPFFRIMLPPHSRQELFLSVTSRWSPVLFGVTLEKFGLYHNVDKKDQLFKIFLLGMIAVLMLYSMVIALYTRDRSYLFYSFYLASVLYQQVGYMGFSHAYLSPFWASLEYKLALPKVGLMLITTALFAMAFLRTRSIPFLHKMYQSIVVLGVVEIGVISFVEKIPSGMVVTMGKGFVVLNILASLFNLIAAVIYYRRGNRQARLYIVGFGVLFVTYLVWTLGTLGLNPMIYNQPNIIIIGTTIEALILSLAFADRYRLLQQAKHTADLKILEEVRNREQFVREEVVTKTAQLKEALDAKELLLHEVHHRVKNNLQIILSMIRLQRGKLSDETLREPFVELENRINAIARTYDMLLVDGDLERIDLGEYIEVLLEDIRQTLGDARNRIRVVTDIQTSLPLRESVYVGLIINELFTNAYKHAFDASGGTITISLIRDGEEVILAVGDDGRGLSQDHDASGTSLGLKLLHALILHQLRGTVEVFSDPGRRYVIRF